MKHFELKDCVDFARGVVSESRAAEMEAHLGAGCKRCRRDSEMFRKFAAAAVSGAEFEVPQYAIHCARAIFSLQQPERVQILPQLLARLVYDSFREPLPAGVRTQQRLSRQTLYEAGDFRLDLRLEQERGSAQVSLVGQIENRKDPSQRMGDVPILLAKGEDVVARTVSNQFGEFHLNYQPKTQLRLHVPVLEDQGRRIEVPLKDLMGEGHPEAGSRASKARRTSKRKR